MFQTPPLAALRPKVGQWLSTLPSTHPLALKSEQGRLATNTTELRWSVSRIDSRVTDALEVLYRRNEVEFPGEQMKEPPTRISTRIPTLDGRGLPMTPMLRARFSYCGRWSGAYLGFTLLSLRQITEYSKLNKMKRRIQERAKYWSPGALSNSIERPGAVALFGDDPVELDEIYLIAPRDGGEPQVVRYLGQDERVFPSLLDFVRFASGQESNSK
jgi:hypothetical protein